MSKKVGVILSGCGFMDGAEIHESVCTLLALDRAGAEVICCAPDVELDVVDHHTGQPTGEKRNVLVESARIARGEIRDTREVQASELDALILPGGFGAAKNLSDFATRGTDATVLADVARLIRECMEQGKPVGAICIAPAVVATVAGERHPRLTIGNDTATASALEALGARHEEQPVDGITIDADHKVVTTPAYMLGPSVAHVARGIDRLVEQVLAMA
jgi:enhancing lycopene biosynthesis protein 2